jgi:hypothetical protein
MPFVAAAGMITAVLTGPEEAPAARDGTKRDAKALSLASRIRIH